MVSPRPRITTLPPKPSQNFMTGVGGYLTKEGLYDIQLALDGDMYPIYRCVSSHHFVSTDPNSKRNSDRRNVRLT